MRARRSPSTKWSTCTAFASSSTASTPVIARWAWCIASTSPCPGASRTTSPFRASTAISRCTRPCSGRTACPSKCRSAPSKCTGSRSPGIAAHWKYKSGGDTFGGVEHDRAREWLASLVQIQARRQLRGIPGERQGRSVPGQGVRVHAEGRDSAPAERCDRGRLCLRHPYRRRQSLRRGQGRSAAGAAAHAAAQRPDRGDHHRQGRDAESRPGRTSW